MEQAIFEANPQRLQNRFLILGLRIHGQRNGGARRDRTDDLKLAKLPLSQLSYGPNQFEAATIRIGGPG